MHRVPVQVPLSRVLASRLVLSRPAISSDVWPALTASSLMGKVTESLVWTQWIEKMLAISSWYRHCRCCHHTRPTG